MSIKLMSAIFETEMNNLEYEKDGETRLAKASTCKLVLLAIADHANDYGESAYPGYDKLQRKTGLSRGGLADTLKALEHNGILKIDTKGSRFGTNNYTVNIRSFSPMYKEEMDLPEIVYPVDSDESSEWTQKSLPSRPESPDKPSDEPSLSEITEKANKTVDFILENERKSQEKEANNETYPHRDKFPEAIREWIDLYVKLTGQHPLKKDVSKWLMDGQDWIDAGFVKKDIIDAYNKSKGDENGYGTFSVTSPGSLTKTANMFAGIRRKGATEEFVRPEHRKFVPEEGNYVPNPNSR